MTILDGDVKGRQVCIVDDLVRSGGTLLECAKALIEHGASRISFFVVHAEFPKESWRKFLPDAAPIPIDTFFVCDSVPDVASELQGKKPFRVLSLMDDVRNFLTVQ